MDTADDGTSLNEDPLADGRNDERVPAIGCYNLDHILIIIEATKF